jgi:hypothetical protein
MGSTGGAGIAVVGMGPTGRKRASRRGRGTSLAADGHGGDPMTDPQRPRDHDAPRRAAPLQPDKPGSGRRRETPGEPPEASTDEHLDRDATQRASDQEHAAVDNAREGYR